MEPPARSAPRSALDPFALRLDRVQYPALGALASAAERLRPELDPRAVEGEAGARVRRRNEDRLREIAAAAEQSPPGVARQYAEVPPEVRVSLWTVALGSDDAAECFEVMQAAHARAELFQHRHANRAEALLDGLSTLVPGSPRQAVEDEARGQITDELLDRAFGDGPNAPPGTTTRRSTAASR